MMQIEKICKITHRYRRNFLPIYLNIINVKSSYTYTFTYFNQSKPDFNTGVDFY